MDTWKRAQSLQTVTQQEGVLLGRLDDFQFDLESHRIFGWSVKTTGMFSKVGGLSVDGLVLLGRDVAFVQSEAAVEWGTNLKNRVEGRAWASSYKGTPVVSRRGESLGSVQDFVLEPTGHEVTGLILNGNLLIALDDRVNTGTAAVIVTDRGALVQLPTGADEDGAAWWDRLRGAVGGRTPALPDGGSDPETP